MIAAPIPMRFQINEACSSDGFHIFKLLFHNFTHVQE
jgi:hypothetical protein